MDLFLFDLAGTLIRDDGLVLGVYREVLGRDAPDEAWLRAHMGRDKRTVFAEVLARHKAITPGGSAPMRDSTPAQLAARFDQAMADALHATPPQAMPGAERVMGLLRAEGVRVGFITGFARATADLIVDMLGWEGDVCVGSDEVAHGRPAPDLICEAMRRAGVNDPANVGVCGDTPSDLRAGHAAGCAWIVGVGNGTHRLEELAPYPHTHLIEDLHAFPLIKRPARAGAQSRHITDD